MSRVNLEWFDGEKWNQAGGPYFNDEMAWVSLGSDNLNYRTVHAETGEVVKSNLKWEHDSNLIFTAVSTSAADITEAKKLVVFGYVPDMSFSRAGISHALKRLEEHYDGTDLAPAT